MKFDTTPAQWIGRSILSAALATGTAQASEWQLVTRSGDGLVAFYVDGSGVARTGATLRVPVLYDYRSAQVDPDTQIAVLSMVAVTAFDCPAHRFIGIEATGYDDHMGRGKVVTQVSPSPQAPPKPVTPKSGSIDAQVFDYVCARFAQRT